MSERLRVLYVDADPRWGDKVVDLLEEAGYDFW